MFSFNRQAEHSTIVFHGLNKSLSSKIRKEFYEFCLSLMMKLNYPPVTFSYKGARKAFEFTRIQKKIPSILMEAENFEIISLPEGVKHRNVYQNCYFGICTNIIDNCIIDFDSSIFSIKNENLLIIVKEIIGIIQPQYGFGFRCPFDKYPTFYALGLTASDAYEYWDARRGNGWYSALEQHLFLTNHWLRDVYPWNFLNRDFLNAPVGNLNLEDWIRQKPKRGTITPLTEGLFLWDVPNEYVDSIGKQLLDAGRVFDYERDYEAKLPSGQDLSMEEATGQILGAFGFDADDDLDIRKGDNKPIPEEQKADIKKKIPKKKKP